MFVFKYNWSLVARLRGYDVKKGLTVFILLNPFYEWCPGRDLNSYRDLAPRDFKSLASTSSATQARIPFYFKRLWSFFESTASIKIAPI